MKCLSGLNRHNNTNYAYVLFGERTTNRAQMKSCRMRFLTQGETPGFPGEDRGGDGAFTDGPAQLFNACRMQGKISRSMVNRTGSTQNVGG